MSPPLLSYPSRDRYYRMLMDQMEPLSVAVNAVCKVAEVRAIDNVAVFGAGPVGLLYVPF